MKHAVPDYPDHPELGSHGEDIPYMTNRLRSVTEDEAIDYLNICKAAYTKAVNEADSPTLASQYRHEIRYWEDYLHANWPEEKAKREPFGGKSEPMSKAQLTTAMDQVFARMLPIPQMENQSLEGQREIVAEIWGVLKTLAAVVDELIKKLE